MLCADHGPCVSGAHNTIVTARAGKDLVSSLVSGNFNYFRSSCHNNAAFCDIFFIFIVYFLAAFRDMISNIRGWQINMGCILILSFWNRASYNWSKIRWCN